jgi:hypothetical protein
MLQTHARGLIVFVICTDIHLNISKMFAQNF